MLMLSSRFGQLEMSVAFTVIFRARISSSNCCLWGVLNVFIAFECRLQLFGIVKHKVQGDGNCQDIGGCDIQKQEIHEAVELPLIHHDLYKQIGIDPPCGVLLYGPPETGKTMLAKAVANHTVAAFVRVVGSEFVQKHLGEGPRMVRDVFRLAKENAPAIIFIDEVDAIATARFDAQTGASSL
ncbi:putative proteasome ATPase [Rosa chinensis]|uniref:Putative proteasome ATPase n=1 Tax=Rosa chinensis TaxID=74649 RepID=A0A2P6QLT5_ROSCH|nr:putative proteasome ATPase [Rosa chinensis]